MKRIPSITNLPPDEDSFKTILEWIGTGMETERLDSLIQSGLNRTKAGATKMRNSLCKYNFLIKKGDGVVASGFAQDFLGGKTDFHAFIYQMLVEARFEMKVFLGDLIAMLKEVGPSTRSGLLDGIAQLGYSAHADRIKRSSASRNLTEILRFADWAEIIRRTEGSVELGPRAETYVRDSGQEDFFRKLRSFVHKHSDTKVLTDVQLLRLHRLSLRAHARGGRWGLEPEIRSAQEFLNSDKLRNKVRRHKKQSRKKRSHRSETDGVQESIFELGSDLVLYDWQKRCLDKWKQSGHKGVIEVVTGAGKTILALAAIQYLKDLNPDLVVSVIVPTKALMYQWKRSISSNLRVKGDDIGLYGDGHNDGFDGSRRIVVFIYNSAVLNDNLFKAVEGTNGCPHFLIVDEVHRSGSPVFRSIYSARYEFAIGLSATPDKPTDTNFEEFIEPALGGIIFKYGFNEAQDEGVIPPFEINNIAVDLTPTEKEKYEQLSEAIRKVVKRLKNRYYDRLRGVSEDLFEATLRKIQEELKIPDKDIAAYFINTSERKRDLYDADNRWSCVEHLLREHEGSRIIMFHESIAAVDWEIYGRSSLRGKPIVIYHSGFPSRDNKLSLELYRRGTAKTLVSVKALVEGLDVPESDIGIIVASSSSPTQRIQSMGRILRTGKTGKKFSRLYVIYARNTTDERIFSRVNWNEITRPDSIHYLLWSEGKVEPMKAPQVITRPAPPEEVDTSELQVGDIYPGSFSGKRLSIDHRGRVFVKRKRGLREYLPKEWREIGRKVLREKRIGGVFTINECGHILVKGKRDGILRTIYLGTIDEKTIEVTEDE